MIQYNKTSLGALNITRMGENGHQTDNIMILKCYLFIDVVLFIGLYANEALCASEGLFNQVETSVCECLCVFAQFNRC